MTELMSLQSIETLASESNDKWTNAATKHLLETARAAHELQAHVTRLREENENMQKLLGTYDQFLVRHSAARAEERERCAKIVESDHGPWARNTQMIAICEYMAEAIRNPRGRKC